MEFCVKLLVWWMSDFCGGDEDFELGYWKEVCEVGDFFSIGYFLWFFLGWGIVFILKLCYLCSVVFEV